MLSPGIAELQCREAMTSLKGSYKEIGMGCKKVFTTHVGLREGGGKPPGTPGCVD